MVGSQRRRSSSRNRDSVQSKGIPCPGCLCGKSHLVSSHPLFFSLCLIIEHYSRFNKATAPSLIKHFRDCVKGAPNELYANVLLTAGPAGKDSLMVVQMCYVGPKEKGQEYLAAISSWDGECCLLNEVDEKSFLHQQDSVAQVLRGKGLFSAVSFHKKIDIMLICCHYPAGRQWFIRSALVSSLPDDIINDTVIEFAGTPVGCSMYPSLALFHDITFV